MQSSAIVSGKAVLMAFLSASQSSVIMTHGPLTPRPLKESGESSSLYILKAASMVVCVSDVVRKHPTGTPPAAQCVIRRKTLQKVSDGC